MTTNGNLFPFWRRLLCILLFTSGALVMLGAITSLRAIDKGDGNISKAALAEIAPWFLQHASNGTEIEFLVVLADQADPLRRQEFQRQSG